MTDSYYAIPGFKYNIHRRDVQRKAVLGDGSKNSAEMVLGLLTGCSWKEKETFKEDGVMDYTLCSKDS